MMFQPTTLGPSIGLAQLQESTIEVMIKEAKLSSKIMINLKLHMK